MAASWAIHLSLALVLGLISALVIPEIYEPEQNIEISFLTDLTIEEEELPLEPEPEPEPPAPKPIPQTKPAPLLAPPPPAPVIPPREVVEVPPPKPQEPKPTQPAPPKHEIRTDLFAQGNPSVPSLEAPARNVQTGGFGNPDGIIAAERTGKSVARANFGAFDLPAGSGQGNGTGGRNGVRGTVGSAGFAEGAATPEVANTAASRDAVRQAGFAEATAPAETQRPKRRVVESSTLPVEIVSKPKPAYTDEARRKHLEGEVVLEVLFSASGRPQVLRIVRGLGSGLDESAVRAAENILFKPARRDGQAVDYTTVVRILFQLT